jgi:hypothetical protein
MDWTFAVPALSQRAKAHYTITYAADICRHLLAQRLLCWSQLQTVCRRPERA